MISRSATTAVLLLLLAARAATAQIAPAGRADLRYAPPMPEKIVYASADSLDITMMGMPTGDMAMNGHVKTRIEVTFTAVKDSVHIRAEVKEFAGEMTTPMMTVPIEQPQLPPHEFTLPPKGVTLDASPNAAANLSLQDMMGQARMASAPFAALPGRSLARGEMWTDTMTSRQKVEEMNVEVTMIVRGTYARDTVANGITLNVIDYRNTTTLKSDGAMQGMVIQQTMEATSVERVLWDSARHIVVARTAESDMAMTTNMGDMGSMRMTGRTRSFNWIEN